MPFPIIAVIGLCKVCALVGGAVFCVHKASKAYNKHQKNKKDKLELKGKSLEEARKENERLNNRNKELESKLNQGEQKEKEIEKQINDTKKELENPNITKQKREELEGKLALLATQLDDVKRNNKNYRDEIKKNNNRKENNNKVISNTASNLDDEHWIWNFLTLENIMIMGVCYVAYKMLKDEKK